ncbi:MAG: hypothetical protein NTV01_18505 [Bacteroidia bacterium]|nr:hypothetical protein [Bacteroidia bacterium]
MSTPVLNQTFTKRKSLAFFWILVALVTSGMTFTGWKADSALSIQLSQANLVISSKVNPSSVRTLNFETRHKTGEGVLDETHTVITGFKVEAFNFINRLPSFYRLRSVSKVSRNYQYGISRLPNSPLALNQILRI